MKDLPAAAIKLLNRGIDQAAATGTFVRSLKQWINELFEKVDVIYDIKDIYAIFSFVVKESTGDDLSGISAILSKLPNDTTVKDDLFAFTRCLEEVCRESSGYFSKNH